jgi:hypothetical protein
VEVDVDDIVTTQEPAVNIVITPVAELTLQALLEVEYVTVPLPEFVAVLGVIVPLTVRVEVLEPG